MSLDFSSVHDHSLKFGSQSRRGSKVEFVECNVDRPRRVTSEIVEVPGPSTSRPGAVVRFSGHWDHNSRRDSNQLASQPAREELV